MPNDDSPKPSQDEINKEAAVKDDKNKPEFKMTFGAFTTTLFFVS